MGRKSEWQVDVSKALANIKNDILKQNKNIEDIIRVLKQHEDEIIKLNKNLPQLKQKGSK